MANPYPTATASSEPLPLTEKGANKVRDLAEHDESEIAKLRPVEASLREELESVRAVIELLRKNVDRYRHRLGEDVISLLQPVPDPSAGVPQPRMAEPGHAEAVPQACTSCGALLAVDRTRGIWTHAGREGGELGFLCWPTRDDSPVATPPADPPMPVSGDTLVAPLEGSLGELSEGQEEAFQRYQRAPNHQRDPEL